MVVKVGINGLGRIGRCVLRAALEYPEIEIIAVNDLTEPKTLAHLLKYDSVHGTFNAQVEYKEGEVGFYVNGKFIKVFKEKDPEALPWKDLGVQVVLESTGKFRTREGAEKHIKAGAEKVVISAPGKGVDATIVMGVNHNIYDSNSHKIISGTSCTTNCLAPVVKVLHDNFGIKQGLMTTIHAYTNDQQLLDLPHKDIRRARAAALSMIPTTTGAAKSVGLIIPELEGKLNGFAVRVPTPNVSAVDLVIELDKKASKKEINSAFKEASENSLKGILGYTETPLVSTDYNGNPYSGIVDGMLTTVLETGLVKVFAWYDNEWGYSVRMLDLIKHIA
ncbi:type I glyceraldehyde-3-phosphate dehydrogenase [Peptococcaceae bacterium]|nr:type I glyceraldehyde-3-phosphate dehydrogenase [Peptococcaceae bacterium]MCL0052607.1 type I glyceraldehyde-3-phosphate dehydrogenase [Peptococcaceae bacterium]MCL0071647.1 type I glyceraldehyde-3-phosphate dehydrogenase [Peptococcaceae bacterium]MCL0100239.1 type I glyceraldehyde-3-phosphate dehydrogenase [Peptococcaceae bacterium]MCL0106252.1 type I glyceraldehyde-3-phosphate dehydrogenase [Peptococcaceae bacterium]